MREEFQPVSSNGKFSACKKKQIKVKRRQKGTKKVKGTEKVKRNERGKKVTASWQAVCGLSEHTCSKGQENWGGFQTSIFMAVLVCLASGQGQQSEHCGGSFFGRLFGRSQGKNVDPAGSQVAVAQQGRGGGTRAPGGSNLL